MLSQWLIGMASPSFLPGEAAALRKQGTLSPWALEWQPFPFPLKNRAAPTPLSPLPLHLFSLWSQKISHFIPIDPRNEPLIALVVPWDGVHGMATPSLLLPSLVLLERLPTFYLLSFKNGAPYPQ